MSALVSFERVFEVLDLEPLIAEKPDAVRGARRAGVGGVRRRAVRLPVGRQGVAGLAGGGRRRSTPAAASRCCTTSRSAPSRGRWSRWSARPAPASRRSPSCCRGSTTSTRARCGSAGVDVRDLTADSIRDDARHGHPGRAPVPRVDPGQPAARPARRRPRTSCGRRCAGPGSADLVASLPDGLDTVVGERGYRLSGGERQRLTIARLLLARPRVVILDEATAHLDSTSEAAVQAALGEALAGRTARGDRAPAVHRSARPT